MAGSKFGLIGHSSAVEDLTLHTNGHSFNFCIFSQSWKEPLSDILGSCFQSVQTMLNQESDSVMWQLRMKSVLSLKCHSSEPVLLGRAIWVLSIAIPQLQQWPIPLWSWCNKKYITLSVFFSFSSDTHMFFTMTDDSQAQSVWMNEFVMEQRTGIINIRGKNSSSCALCSFGFVSCTPNTIFHTEHSLILLGYLLMVNSQHRTENISLE